MDTSDTQSEINAQYSLYRVAAETSMRADNYHPSVSASSSSPSSETKQSKQDKRIRYVAKHKQLASINAQLSIYETMALTQQQRKQQAKLHKDQAKLAKGLRKLSTQLKLHPDEEGFLTSEPWLSMMSEWLHNQVTVVLPKAILKLKLQWKYAVWVNAKPQIRDNAATQAKQKHATKKRNNNELKRENLIAKIAIFNQTLHEIPLPRRPTGLKEIPTTAPSLEKAIDAGLGPCSQKVAGSGEFECPVELKRLFALKDKIARIDRGLEINRDDRKYLVHYLESQERDLKKALSHAHFTPSSLRAGENDRMTTDIYARRGLLSKKLFEISNALTLVRVDVAKFLVDDQSLVIGQTFTSCSLVASSIASSVPVVVS